MAQADPRPDVTPHSRAHVGGPLAVDYFHYLIVTGPRTAVGDFVHRIALVVERRVAGKRFRQTVPFSFESMYAMGKLKGEVPGDPFDLTRWPIARRGKLAEVRYRFHTRSLELHPLLKRFSKATPRLRFALVTNCLDDNDFAPFAIQKGKLRGRWLGDAWREPFYERAAREYKMTLEEVYEDDVVESIAESWMTEGAMQIATGTNRRHEWGGGRVYRDLDDERGNAMLELVRAIKRDEDEPE